MPRVKKHVTPPTINVVETMELYLFVERFARKRPRLNTEQKKWLRDEILQRGILGEETFIDIANSIPKGDRRLLPEQVFVKQGLIACSCTALNGDKLWGIWPNAKKKAVCAKQELFLSTLCATLIETRFKEPHTVDVVSGLVIIDHHDEACRLTKDLVSANQHSTQSE